MAEAATGQQIDLAKSVVCCENVLPPPNLTIEYSKLFLAAHVNRRTNNSAHGDMIDAAVLQRQRLPRVRVVCAIDDCGHDRRGNEVKQTKE